MSRNRGATLDHELQQMWDDIEHHGGQSLQQELHSMWDDIDNTAAVDAGLRGLGEGDDGTSMWEGASKILEQVFGYARDAVKIYQDLDSDKSETTVLALKDTADKATAALERSTAAATAAAAAASLPNAAPSSPAPSGGGRDSNLLILGGLAVGAWWLWSRKKGRRRR